MSVLKRSLFEDHLGDVFYVWFYDGLLTSRYNKYMMIFFSHYTLVSCFDNLFYILLLIALVPAVMLAGSVMYEHA